MTSPLQSDVCSPLLSPQQKNNIHFDECVCVCLCGRSLCNASILWHNCDSVIQGPFAFNGLLVLSVYNQFPVRKRGTVSSFLKPMNSHSFLSAVSDGKLLIKSEKRGLAHKKKSLHPTFQCNLRNSQHLYPGPVFVRSSTKEAYTFVRV